MLNCLKGECRIIVVYFLQFISLASHIFLLMNNCLVESDCAYVQQYVRGGLAESHMIVLAAIIRDLDKETCRSDPGYLHILFFPKCVCNLMCLIYLV